MPDYGRPNTAMMQYGMQMLQPRPPGYQTPYASGASQFQMQYPQFNAEMRSPQALQKPYSQDEQPTDEAPSPQGKRRIRIGNRTYVEEDNTPAGAQIGNRGY